MKDMNTENGSLKVLDLIREDIFLGKIKSGSFIRQETLAECFGVSRTPVREALKALESEGLLENVPNCGFKVKERSLRDLIEIVDIRALLEGYAARLVTLIGDPEFSETLHRIANKISETKNNYLKTKEKKDLIEWSNQERKFHQAIIDGSGNALLIRLVQNTDFRWQELLPAGVPNPQEKLVPTHREIADVIASGDADEAELLARKHISYYKNISIESHLGPVSRYI